jgi:F-type H+-transporting ATPase subunit gamma
MQNLRSLRQRIRSVQNTQKITKAMQMVAGAKLRRSLEELVSFRPYAEGLGQVARRFLSAHPGLQHPLLGSDPKEAKGVRPFLTKKGLTPKGSEGSDPFAPAGLIIITSDTGLCGTYNEKVLGAAVRFRMEFPSAVVVAIGKKGTRSLAHHGGPRPVQEIVTWGGRYDAAEAGALLGWLEAEYLGGKVSSWNVAYTRFLSALSWKPVVERLLPEEKEAARIGTPGFAGRPAVGLPPKVIAEPDAAVFADRLLRRQLRSQFARVLLEAFTAEHSARMVAMKNATENADEMISSLTLVRNKARQAAITKELIEVVSGAEALK